MNFENNLLQEPENYLETFMEPWIESRGIRLKESINDHKKRRHWHGNVDRMKLKSDNANRKESKIHILKVHGR